MTFNQIQYANHLESQRHNKETESIQRDTLTETQRHNKEGENISWFANYETKRHNQETEGISWFNAYENQRHNQASESINWFNAHENQRHNQASESIQQSQVSLGYAQLNETSRHNKQLEVQGWKSTGIAESNAYSNRVQAEASQRNAETNASKEKYFQEKYAPFYMGIAVSNNVSDWFGDVGRLVDGFIPF